VTTAQITVDQAVIEKALVAHLFGEMMTHPESRDQLLQDLIAHILKTPERSHEKESLLEKTVKEQLSKKCREIADEWLSRPETAELIRVKIEELLKTDYVQKYMEQLLGSAIERMKRLY